MFATRSKDGYKQALDGIEQKTLVHGAETLMVEFVLRKGAVLRLTPILMSRPAIW